MGCKGLCVNNMKRGIYSDGYKSCSQCRRFFRTTEARCMCCGLLLKSKPRSMLRRKVHNEKMGIARL